MNLELLDDGAAVAERAAGLVADACRRAIAERGRFAVAFSGGSTPRGLLELLALRDDIEWPFVHIFQVDERVAPDGHADRNATMLSAALITDSFVERARPAGVWLMPVTSPDLEEAADEYAKILDRVTGSPVVLDLVQLGLGADGHTASLVPDDPVLQIGDRDVAITREYSGRRRMTLTWPALDRAKEQLWLVVGASKREALDRYLDNDPTIPATLPTQARATVLADRAASTTGQPNDSSTASASSAIEKNV